MSFDLDELEKLVEAATPGPWFHYGDGILRGAHLGCGPEEKANVEFIVKARSALPGLIAELRAARDCIEALKNAPCRLEKRVKCPTCKDKEVWLVWSGTTGAECIWCNTTIRVSEHGTV